MDSRAQIITDGSFTNDELTTGTAPIVELTRHDTISSAESVPRLSEGRWALNLSGNCSTCHHHHKSVQVRVQVSGDSTEFGDVYCHKCQKLWLAFGKVNGTRLSLLSTKSLEPEMLEAEADFRKTLVQAIQSATPIATLSPTLTVIPEGTPAGPSRETSVRSTAHRDTQQHPASIGNHPGPVSIESSNGEQAPGLSHVRSGGQRHATFRQIAWSKGRQAITRLRLRITARLRTSKPGPLVTRSSSSSPDHDHHRQIHAPLPADIAPAVDVSDSLDDSTEACVDLRSESNHAAPDVCALSATATDALASLRNVDPRIIHSLSPQERWEWGRRQLTDFRTLYAGSTVPIGDPVMINSGTQANLSEDSLLSHRPLTRRHSALAFVGNTFGTHDYWDVFRGSTQTFHNRPLSMSETNLSDAETAVERISIAPTTHQLLIDTLHRDRRGSGSSRPLSMHSVVHEWQQHVRNRAEVRLSIDSAATGGAVRNIAVARARANNRLSRNSMSRASYLYDTELGGSRVQLPVAVETEHSNIPEHAGSPLVSPPSPEADVRSQG
ncbi:hypothetical protein BKA58DRAFT_400899 [Alternaria rosae]|uniref:uncharacterized protein n=1 Tax=Alternaria rosae TaxID=1187941 RepID=UPI001E8CCA78|nr:uncharacterized protein BKA58DRAFT_400899 [Alternaria rosae]KAH6872696.1 hypothetical protein BKA58DRAFT_400899 [Alternaria rosae]